MSAVLSLPRDLLDSRTWRDLRPAARAIYIEICLGFDGTNNGAICLTVAEAIFATWTSVGTVQRALRELSAAGLIQNTGRGERFAAKWRLMHLPNDPDGTAPKLQAA